MSLSFVLLQMTAQISYSYKNIRTHLSFNGLFDSWLKLMILKIIHYQQNCICLNKNPLLITVKHYDFPYFYNFFYFFA